MGNIPGTHLARPSVATTVMSNAAIALVCQKHHLVLPIVGTQGPPMTEDYYRSIFGTPVFVVDLGAIFDRDGRHDNEVQIF